MFRAPSCPTVPRFDLQRPCNGARRDIRCAAHSAAPRATPRYAAPPAVAAHERERPPLKLAVACSAMKMDMSSPTCMAVRLSSNLLAPFQP